MNADPLDTLLEKLCSGDATAAERVFLTYEPYLRLLVRRQISPQLRAKFDSIDVVQSVFADILDGFRQGDWQFQDSAHLRAFLVKLTRNRFIDRVREYRTAIRREQPLAAIDSDILPASRQPRPSEFAAAEDLWDRLLAICPPRHHELLRLKREGRSVGEIVERTGLNDGSIRRILRELARRLAFQRGAATRSECNP
jgi:RNA polymerase sigma-70 factor (ECF subfamily)